MTTRITQVDEQTLPPLSMLSELSGARSVHDHSGGHEGVALP